MWFTKGIKTFGGLFKDGSFQTFEDLSFQYGLLRTHFFKYLQVRHFVISEQGSRLQTLGELALDKLVRDKQGVRGFISYIYSGIIRFIGQKVLGVKRKWEKDLECNFEEVDWEDLCTRSQNFSFNARHKITQYSLIHRIYYTPDRLHRIKPQYSQFCPRCKTEVGTMIHVLGLFMSKLILGLNTLSAEGH